MIAKGRIAVMLAACLVALTAASDSAPMESEVLARINHARQNPRQYAQELREYRRYFDGRVLFLPGDPNGVYTREGTAAVDEAIDFLERQAPLPPLSRGDLLALAAQDHAGDQGAMGETGHVSRDGAGPGERVRRRGGDIFVGESIYYGAADPAQVVRNLIVDDGVAGRGHRALLFKADFRYAGVGCSDHRRFGHICVVDLSATADGTPDIPAWARARGAKVFRAPLRRGEMASAEAAR